MNDFAAGLLPHLVRATLWLSVCAVAGAAVLRLARVNAPALHRAACIVPLLVGCLFVQLPLDVPWYPAEPPETPIKLAQVPPAKAAWAELPPIPVEELMSASEATPSAVPVFDPHTLEASAEPPMPTPPAWRPNWQALVAVGWLAGMGVMAAVWLGGYLWFVWRLPRSSAGEPQWEQQWQAMLSAEGLRATPLRVTDAVGPLLCRLPGGYELVVPERLWRKLRESERAAILRHELAHLRRHDVWKSLIAHLLALPHWFNPLAWWTVRRFDEAAEWACDRAAATEPAAYATILVRLSELAGSSIRFSSAMSRRPLAARIRRLVRFPEQEDSMMKRSLVIALVICLAAMALVRVRLVAQEAEPASQEVPSAEPPSDAFYVDDPIPPTNTEAPPSEPVDPNEDLYSDELEPKSTKKSRPSGSNDDLFGEPVEPRVKPKFAEPVEVPGPAATPDAVRAAKQKMVEAAKRSYQANEAGWDSGTATFDYVTFWSDRWLAAELNLANNRAEQVAAAKAHLKRMQLFHQKVTALHESGSRGGEANVMAAAEYYVADAERKLAEIESSAVMQRHFRQRRLAPGVGTVEEDVVVSTPLPRTAPQTYAPGDVPVTSESAPPTYAPATEFVTALPPPRSATPLAPPRPTSAAPPSDRAHTLGPPPGTPVATPDVIRSPTPSQRRERVYKDPFDQWREEFEIELDLTSRLEALQALRQFAANGYAKEVVPLLVKEVGKYSPSQFKGPDTSDTNATPLYVAAVRAVQAAPLEDALPVLAKYLSEGDDTQRVFVLYALATKNEQRVPSLVKGMEQFDPKSQALTAALVDENDEVSEAAMDVLRSVDDVGPRFITESVLPALKRVEASGDAEAARRAGKIRESLEDRPSPYVEPSSEPSSTY
ncbi:MAG: hypothetical protein DWQ37_23555 [Planctomycetota bacterium]|nr:MAG: hypothetical protein DWQ37_23555 [Planctomycetota bacterium]